MARAEPRAPAEQPSKSVAVLTSAAVVVGLCTLVPIANFIAINAQEPRFSVACALVYFVAIAAAGLAAALALERTVPRAPRGFGRVFVGLAVLVTLNGYLIDRLVFDGTFVSLGITPRVRYIALIYAGVLALALPAAWVIARRPVLLAAAMVGMAGFAATDAVAYALDVYANVRGSAAAAEAADEARAEPEAPPARTGAPPPNVYFVIPDMMVGRRVFPDFGVDTAVFDDLEAMGFVVPARAYANAPVTTFSMMHTLSMEHFLSDGGRIDAVEMAAIQDAVAEPRLYREFKARGYRIVAVDDGYYGECGSLTDRCVSRGGDDVGGRYQDIRFLDRTPFVRALDVLDMKYSLFDPPLNLWAYPHRMEMPEIIERLPAPKTGPFLYVLHHALPHYPLRFDRDCRPHRYPDLDTAYGAQLACAAKQMRRLAERIVAGDPGAIVILQSDHGISFNGQHQKPVAELTDAELEENLNIFVAYKLPAECRSHIGDDHTPVNTFRVVLACIDGREPDLVANRIFAVYYPHWPSGGRVREWRPE